MDGEWPARYAPWAMSDGGETVSGLWPFGTDFGNGAADRQVFQFDSEFDRFADNKRAALRERRSKYVRAFRLSPSTERATVDLIVERLAREYPGRFGEGYEGEHRTLTEDGKTWVLPAGGRGNESQSLDMLARIVPEDFAVVATEHAADWVAYIHFCAPTRLAAEELVGRSLFDLRKPSFGFGRVISESDMMVNKGPFVRFTWGLESDDRLNHHPEPPSGWETKGWQGRQFGSGRFWVRTERQVIWGMPGVGAALLVNHVGHISDTEVRADDTLRASLRDSLRSFSADARSEQGLVENWAKLMSLID